MADAVEDLDLEALTCGESFGCNPVGLLFRHVFQERLRQLFTPGWRVLDLGCGTGEDALFLASLGVAVRGLDAAPRMIERAAAEAARRGVPEAMARFEVGAVEEAAGTERGFDGAYSNFGALNRADLTAVGAALALALRPGAPLLLSLLGRWPLPAMLARGLTGRGEGRGRSELKGAGIPGPARYPSPREARGKLGPAFEWRRQFSLGVLVPGPLHAPWAARNPQAFGLLAAFEGVVRGWPLLRTLGAHAVLEGVRR